jgi:hypothetical protein
VEEKAEESEVPPIVEEETKVEKTKKVKTEKKK